MFKLKKFFQKWIIQLSLLAIGITVAFAPIAFVGKAKPFDITTLLKKDSKIRKEYATYVKRYQNDNVIWLLLESPIVLEAKKIEALLLFAKSHYYKFDEVKEVIGLNNTEYLSYKNSSIHLTSFIENSQWSALAKEKLETTFWKSLLINDEQNALLVQINLKKEIDPLREKDLIRQIKEDVEQWSNMGVRAYFMGTKVGQSYFLDELKRNQTLLTPLLFIILGLLIFYLYRKLKVLALFFLIMLMSQSFVLCCIFLFEGGPNPYSGFSLFFVLIVSTSDLIHYFTQLAKQKTDDVCVAVSNIKKEVFLPCFLTSLTTSICFSSLCFNDMKPIAFFGVYCAIGCIIAFILTFYFLPLLIKSFNIRVEDNIFPIKKRFDSLVHRLVIRPKRVCSFSIILLIFLILSSMNLQFEDDFYNKFKSNHPFNDSISKFQEHFSFVSSVDLIVKSKGKYILDNESIKTLTELEKELTNVEEIAHFHSLNQLMNNIRTSIFKEDEGIDKKELNARTQSVAYLMNDYSMFETLYDEQNNSINISLFLKSTRSDDLRSLIKKINLIFKNKDFKGFQYQLMGFPIVRHYLMDRVLGNFVVSFSFSIVIIFVIFIFVFKKISWAFLAMIPNLFPLIFISGCLGLFGVAVDSNLVILICVSLGIAVDDTIHFLFNLKKELSFHELDIAIRNAYNKTSQALVGTTFVFILSFPVFFLANLKLFQQMGLFIMCSLIIALLCDFILLPILLRLGIKNR